tara:strand:- start:1268 stop:1489 length:222 start_codon:yes stop_codon:yes gene_type:complete
MNSEIKVKSPKSLSPKSPSQKCQSPKSPSPTYLSPRTQEYNSKYECYAPKITTRKNINNPNFQKFILDRNLEN